MALIFEADRDPGTHVLIIGAGAYPALIDGSPDHMLKDCFGMGQLTSPPLSARQLADWFLRPTDAGHQGYVNPHAPLASLDLLLSPGGSYVGPDGTEHSISEPTGRNVRSAFAGLLDRAGEDPESVIFFFFCGHGMQAVSDCILPSDFGMQTPRNPVADAIDIRTTASGCAQTVAARQLFFVDACRMGAIEAHGVGNQPPAVVGASIVETHKTRSRAYIASTDAGRAAHGRPNAASFFTDALLRALSGYRAAPLRDRAFWGVNATHLANGIRALLAEANDDGGEAQQPVTELTIGPEPIQYLRHEPEIIETVHEIGEMPPPEQLLDDLPPAAQHWPDNLRLQLAEEKAAANTGERFTFADFFDVLMPKALRLYRAIALERDLVVRVDVANAGIELGWTIVLRGSEPFVTRARLIAPDLTLNATVAALDQLVDGELDPTLAIESGDVWLNSEDNPQKLLDFGNFLAAIGTQSTHG